MLKRMVLVSGLMVFLSSSTCGGQDDANVKGAVVRPAANPAKITPTKAADKAEIKLPGSADMTCFGGGGRYVLFRLPKVKQVAVLDVCEGKIVKYIPLAEEGAMIAAGNEHLFVLNPNANAIQRWNLTTFTKEATAANPIEGTARGLLMGHATDGPVFIHGPHKFFDAQTFREVAVPTDEDRNSPRLLGLRLSYQPSVRISGDGRVLAWHTPEMGMSGLSSMVMDHRGAKVYAKRTTVGAIIPGPDGTLFTACGIFTPDLKPIGGTRAYQYWFHAPIPAAHGHWYLSIPDADSSVPRSSRGERTETKVTLKMLGEDNAVVVLNNLEGFDIPKKHNQTMSHGGLQLHDRVFLVPDAKVMAVLNGTADKVYLHKLEVEDLLEKAGIDYLFVASRPPGAVRGETFTYKPEVKSRKGGVKVKLDAGPEGMKVAEDGTLTWEVPKDFAEASVAVILTVSDKSGQETLHTFNLVVGKAPEKP